VEIERQRRSTVYAALEPETPEAVERRAERDTFTPLRKVGAGARRSDTSMKQFVNDHLSGVLHSIFCL